jgi:hypothetical protein
LEKITDGKFHTVYLIYSGKETFTGGVQFVQFNLIRSE